MTEHLWDHSLGEVVTALIQAGLRIDFLHEFDFVDWGMDLLAQSEVVASPEPQPPGAVRGADPARWLEPSTIRPR